MRRIIRVSVLMALLTCPTYAGYIQNGNEPPPPPPPAASASVFTEAALSLLQTVLAIV